MAKKFLEWLSYAGFLILFYLAIYVGWGLELCRKAYFVVFRIPHIKLKDKFHPIYVRWR